MCKTTTKRRRMTTQTADEQATNRGLLKHLSRIWILTGLVALLTGLIAAAGLWHLRTNAFEAQSRELGLLSLALTDEVDRGLQDAEEGLRAVQADLNEGRIPMEGTSARRSLKTFAGLMPLFRKLWVVNNQGILLSASDTSAAPQVEYFGSATDQSGGQNFVISRTYVDTKSKEIYVAMAVPFKAVNGKDGGWIFAGIPASKLLGAFSAASPSPDAKMAVYRGDGVLLAGSIVATTRLNESEIAKRLVKPRDIQLHTFQDGTTRLVSMHSLDHFDLRIILTRDLSVVLLGWQDAAQLSGFVGAVVLLILVTAVYFVQRANSKRSAAQHALQQQLTRASKLEALGTMAGGVAHDFNNILAAIVGYAEMAQDSAVPKSTQERHLAKVLQAGLRGKNLVEQILVFSKGGAKKSVPFELETVVVEVLEMISISLKPGILIERRLVAPGAKVQGDPTQVYEAVMNLLTNAMQSMPNGGALVLSLERVAFQEMQILSHSQIPAAGYITLTVSDQGTGITPAVMEHLFEPFFTTKGAHAGTGLGLAVVHGVMSELHGGIDVSSEPLKGSRFTLYFPETAKSVPPDTALMALVKKGSGQAILVVDDDAGLMEMTVQELTSLGYAPVGFTNPLLALDAVTANPDRFQLIVTDEVMPEMTGTQFATRLRAVLPDIPIMLVSGYGGALLAQRALESGISRVLTKPVQRSDLAEAIAELLTK